MKRSFSILIVILSFFLFSCGNSATKEDRDSSSDTGNDEIQSNNDDNYGEETPDDDNENNNSEEIPDDYNNEPDDGENNAGNLTCAEIYQCMADCYSSDEICMQNCMDRGSPEGQSHIKDLLQCLNGCYSDGISDEACLNSLCRTEISNCGLTYYEPYVPYASPYGSLSLDFSANQIANDSDGQDSTAGIVQSAFATGTYGNGSTSITPADAYMIQTTATYSVDISYGNTVMVQQIPVYDSNGQNINGNPVVIFVFEEKNAAVGTLNTSIYPNYQAQLYVIDIDWNSDEIGCFHAFGEGSVNITGIGDIADHGALAFNGSVMLYSPKNYNGNGDISVEIRVTVCDPVQ